MLGIYCRVQNHREHTSVFRTKFKTEKMSWIFRGSELLAVNAIQRVFSAQNHNDMADSSCANAQMCILNPKLRTSLRSPKKSCRTFSASNTVKVNSPVEIVQSRSPLTFPRALIC